MCIIIAKKKHSRLPSITELKTAFNHNKDGAGLMYVKNGKVIIDKGYMTYDAFYKHYKALCREFNNFKDKSLVIHFRIGTSGGNTPENTHPYPLSNKISKMHKLHSKCKIGIAHNGVIHDYEPDGDGYNDTMEFIKSFLYPISKFDKRFYKRDVFNNAIQDAIGYSKLAILDTNDELTLIGSYVTDNNLYFSNSTYKDYTSLYDSYYPNYINYNNYSNYSTQKTDNDWYDSYYNAEKNIGN